MLLLERPLDARAATKQETDLLGNRIYIRCVCIRSLCSQTSMLLLEAVASHGMAPEMRDKRQAEADRAEQTVRSAFART